jgi:capsular polysaccharide biosynthesis protein
MLSLCPHPYWFPWFGRCSGVVSLEKSDKEQRMREGTEQTLTLEQDEVYHNLFHGSDEPKAAMLSGESYPRKLYVSHLANAFVTHQGGYITRNSHLIEEFSQYFDYPIEEHRYLHSLRLFRKIRKINQPIVSLTGMGQYNYHHWWMDILPKFHLMRTYGEIPSGSLYYVEASKPFQRETLGYLGIEPSSLLNSRETQIIKTQHLIAASPRSPRQKPDQWAVTWLRTTFSPFAKSSHGQPQCILISRKRAKNRGFTNEDQIVDCLAPLLPVVVDLEDLTVAEQIGLFAGARWIIAPHGAGLTNLLFARSDCRVIELFGSIKINDCYRHLAESVGCSHTFLLGEDVVDSHTGEKSIQTNIAALKATLFG